MESIRTENIRTQPIKNLYHHLEVDVLRLDLIHPVVSGNKWFKLKHYLRRVQKENKKGIITFGGAYSNHIIATAVACAEAGIDSVGIIRGERPANSSYTLQEAGEAGMQLLFTSRESYRSKLVPDQYDPAEWLVVDEGGYGPEGASGAAEILQLTEAQYDHVICGVGTGTTLGGLCAVNPNCIGIPVVKNDHSLEGRIKELLPRPVNFQLMNDYHFGGYAKFDQTLIDFMNQWYNLTSIPTDFVYTGKVFFAVNDMIRSGYFKNAEKLLVIHTGGLQGNRSLPKGTLIF